MSFRPFPSIEQFRHCVADVRHRATYIGKNAAGEALYDETLPQPTLVFEGTVKLHGTNAGVRFERAAAGWAVAAQSRTRDLTPDDDNSGFATWVATNEVLAPLLLALVERSGVMEWEAAHTVTLFGEWVGQGVNGKTAIGKLSKRLVLFGMAVDAGTEEERDVVWPDLMEVRAKVTAAKGLGVSDYAQAGVYFINDFQTWAIPVDFENPEAALEQLETLTLEVEAECPVAKAMGSEGIGEGIVWTHNSPEFGHLRFKTKGLKHKGTKSKRVADIAPEVLAGRKAFVDAVLTESRLEQGLDYLVEQGKSISRDHLGLYLEWMGKDVLKEESDTMRVSGLEKKDVMKAVNLAAKDWFLANVSALAS